LPLDAPLAPMRDGLWWAMIVRVLLRLADGSLFWTFVFAKALLVFAWWVMLRGVDRLMVSRTPIERCLALVMMGWLPLGVVYAVGEGNADGVLLAFLLVWLQLLTQSRATMGTFTLVLAALTRWAAAPLLLLDVLRGRLRWVRPVLVGVAIALLSTTVLRDVPRLPRLSFEPAAAFSAFGVGGAVVGALARVLFAVPAAIALWQYARDRSDAQFWRAFVAAMVACVFCVSPGVEAAQLLWLLLAGALVPESKLGRWAIGLAIAAPFLPLLGSTFPDQDARWTIGAPALLAYAGSLVWFVAWPRLSGAVYSEPAPARETT
jgi:hypothetical protein